MMHEDPIAHRQKNANQTLWLSLLSFVLFAVATWASCTLFSRWIAITGAVLLLIPSITLQCTGGHRDLPSFCSLMLNSLANGLIVSVYYLHFHITVTLGTLLMGLLLPFVLLLCTYLFLGLIERGRSWLTVLQITAIFSALIGSVVKWVQTGSVIYSFTFFSTVFVLLYTIAYLVTLRRPELTVTGALSVGSYGVMGVLVVVVIALVSEGETFDGILEGIGDIIADCFPTRNGKPGHKKPPARFE